MSTHSDLSCGGENARVEIVSPISCRTWSSDYFARGDNVYWENSELGSCNGKTIDNSRLEFKIIASSWLKFCPKYVTVYISGYGSYKSGYMDHWHDNSDNSKRFYAYKQ